MKKLLSLFIALSFFACNNEATNSETKTTETTTETATETPTESNGVFVVNHKDGDSVTSPVVIEMGVRGMAVEPAGEVKEGMGHHHIIIDGSFVEKDSMVPADDTHLHYGKGQLVDTLPLSVGTHTITLQFANGMHMSYGKDWSSTITLHVIK